jgi:uncharacterized CHY-type Zn-finger protein
MHRKDLLASEVAACYHCFAKFSPETIIEWCDGEAHDKTAICPHCGVDAVVGFNGLIDDTWLKTEHDRGFNF